MSVGLLVAVGTVVVGVAVGSWHRRRDGRLRSGRSERQLGGLAGPLGVRPGVVTLLQFSSEHCAPCRAARATCAALAGARNGVAHVEVDAANHLDEVRRLDIWRTPTILVIDPAGRIAHRASGAPDRAALAAVVDPLLPDQPPERRHAA